MSPCRRRFPALVPVVILLGCAPDRPDEIPADALVKRGAYLVNIGGCHDCHSPKVANLVPQPLPPAAAPTP